MAILTLTFQKDRLFNKLFIIFPLFKNGLAFLNIKIVLPNGLDSPAGKRQTPECCQPYSVLRSRGLILNLVISDFMQFSIIFAFITFHNFLTKADSVVKKIFLRI
jgi:hypothetical protein